MRTHILRVRLARALVVVAGTLVLCHVSVGKPIDFTENQNRDDPELPGNNSDGGADGGGGGGGAWVRHPCGGMQSADPDLYPLPFSSAPVDLFSGHKLEHAVDLVVELAGRDFELGRQYTSRLVGTTTRNPVKFQRLLGVNWWLDGWPTVKQVDILGDDLPDEEEYQDDDGDEREDTDDDYWFKLHVHRSAQAVTEFWPKYESGARVWRPGRGKRYGPSTQYAYPDSIDVGPNSAYGGSPPSDWIEHDPSKRIPVFVVSEPGDRQLYFYRLPHELFDNLSAVADPDSGASLANRVLPGLLREIRDEYGNRSIFSYYKYNIPNYGGGGTRPEARIRKIDFYARDRYAIGLDDIGEATTEPDARLEFFWVGFSGDTSPSSQVTGRLRAVRLLRHDGTQWVETHRVVYEYFADDSGNNTTALGAYLADLVEVRQYERVDGGTVPTLDPSYIAATPESGSGAFYAARLQVTQYRYHNGDVNTGGGGGPEDGGLVDALEDLDLPVAEGEGGGNPNPPNSAFGAPGQLKMVLLPAQIEHFAQEANVAEGATASVVQRARELRATYDHLPPFTGADYKVYAMASKYLPVYELEGEQRIRVQYLLSGCGCGANGLGTKLAYEYLPDDPDLSFTLPSGTPYARTTRITEYISDSGAFSESTPVNRIMSYDFVEHDKPTGGRGVPLLANEVITDSEGRHWVIHYAYDSPDPMDDDERSGRLLKRFMPSSTASYTPASGSTGPTYTAKTDGAALVYRYGYNSDNRVTTTELAPKDDAGEFKLVGRTTWGDGTFGSGASGHTWAHLPVKEERFRTTGSSPGSDDIEVVEYRYTFHNTDATYEIGIEDGRIDEFTRGDTGVASIETIVEMPLVSENGNGGTASSIELFDAAGRRAWTRDPDGALMRWLYPRTTGSGATTKPGTGASVAVLQNAPPSQAVVVGTTYDALPEEWPRVNNAPTPTNPFPKLILDADWDGRHDDGGELLTVFTRDVLGRIRESKGPGQVSAYIVREMRPFDHGRSGFTERARMSYYTEVVLPPIVSSGDGTFGGPATVTWMSAGDQVLGVSDFSLTASSPGYGGLISGYTFALDEELTRMTAQSGYTGVVTGTRVWHNIGASPASSGYSETLVAYDGKGREKHVRSPEGTYEAVEYDALDRVLRVKTGTSTGSLDLVRENEYDGGGAGNGNLTKVIDYTGQTGSGTYASRTTEMIYDWRDRLIAMKNPEPPHTFVVYDNLDRITEQAVFKGSAPPSSIGSSLSDRGTYEKREYSQRGQLFRRSLAIDATQSSPTFIEWNYWRDENSRLIALWAPNAPGRKALYDGLGRPFKSYATDRKSDDGPGVSGGYADAQSVSDDVILEQVETHYVEQTRSGTTGVATLQDRAGLPKLLTRRQRAHDAPDTFHGDLSSNSARAVTTFTGLFYDAADRLKAVAEYGTNQSGFVGGGAAPTVNPTSDPAPSDTVLVSKIGYDARGMASMVTDPAGIVTRHIFDDQNRLVGTIENFVDGAVSRSATPWAWTFNRGADPTDGSEDRTTLFGYDASGNLRYRVAVNLFPDMSGLTEEEEEVTEYIYGVSPSNGSTITSNDLLASIIYPDEKKESPSSPKAYRLRYNRLGELIGVIDQNDTAHALERDRLGRVRRDAATLAMGSAIDGYVDAITVDYDDFGRRSAVKSMNGSTVRNAVLFEYTPLWLLEDFWQDPDSDVSTTGSDATSRRVTYGYAVATRSGSSGNTARLTSLAYPSEPSGGTRTTLDYLYGSGSGVDDRISRPTVLEWDGPGGAHDATFSYVGLRSPVVTAFGEPAIRLDRFVDAVTGAGTSGTYAGLDRFGRVARQLWVRDSWWSSGTGVVKPAIVDLEYAYDRASNIKARNDRRANDRVAFADRDERYTYDALHRLTRVQRGKDDRATPTPSFTLPTASSGGRSQDWVLDAVGNWMEFGTDGNNDGVFSSTGPDRMEEGSFSFANELIGRAVSGEPSPALANTYDAVGNLLTRQVRPSGTGTPDEWTYVYDAWNRLVEARVTPEQVAEDGQVRARYRYNGLHHRVARWADADSDPTTGDDESAASPARGFDERNLYYYDAAWRLLEEHVDARGGEPEAWSLDRIVQRVWGLDYIDQLIAMQSDRAVAGTPPDGGFGDALIHYAVLDRRFDVVALVDGAGSVQERVRYDAYGLARHHRLGDVNGDGATGSGDLAALLAAVSGGSQSINPTTNTGYTPEMDVDENGLVQFSSDYAAMAGGWGGAILQGQISLDRHNGGGAVEYANTVGYCGYLYDPAVDLYLARFRWYDPRVGRWVNRDPLDYVDGNSQYEYVASNPMINSDPAGLCGGSSGSGGGVGTGGGGAGTRSSAEEQERERKACASALNDRANKIFGASTSTECKDKLRKGIAKACGRGGGAAAAASPAANAAMREYSDCLLDEDESFLGTCSSIAGAGLKGAADGAVSVADGMAFDLIPDNWRIDPNDSNLKTSKWMGVVIVTALPGSQALASARVQQVAASSGVATASTATNTLVRRLSPHALQRMTRPGAEAIMGGRISEKMVDATLRKGAKYFDPKNNSIVSVLSMQSGKQLAVAESAIHRGYIKTVMYGENLVKGRFICHP